MEGSLWLTLIATCILLKPSHSISDYEAGIPFDLGCGKDLDVVILLDTTLNNSTQYEEFRQFLLDLVEDFQIDSGITRVGFVTFSSRSVLHFRLDKYNTKADVKSAIKSAVFTPGERNFADAFDLLRRRVFFEPYGDRSDAPNVILLITTGTSDRNAYQALQQAKTLKDQTSIVVISKGVSNMKEIHSIASEPYLENTYELSATENISLIKDLVYVGICSITTNYYDLEEMEGSAVSATVKTLTTISEPSPSNIYEESTQDNIEIATGIDSNVKADIVVVFHAGHKTKAKEFKNNLLNFLSSLFAKARIDSGDVKVALVNYGLSGKILFNFNKYTKKSDLRKAIRKSSPKVRNSNANLGDALQLVRTKLFTKQEGSRLQEGVPSAVILVTDMASSKSSYSVQDEANRLKQDLKTTIFTVGVEKADLKEMQTISSAPTGIHYQSVSKYKDLVSNKDILANVLDGIRALQGRKSQKKPKATIEPGLNTAPWSASAINLGILFQSYGTTSPKNFHKQLLPFMANVTQYPDLLKHRTDVAVFNYGKGVNVIKQFKGSVSLNEARNVILGLSKKLRSKSAALCKAVEEALNAFQKLGNVKTASNQILIITDTVTSDDCSSVLDVLRNSSVEVQAIHIGSSQDKVLQSISEQKGGGLPLKVGSYQDLLTQSHVLEVVAQNILYNADTNERRLNTRNKIGKATDGSSAKIAILVHASTRVSKRNFKKQFLKYVIKLVKRSKIGPNGVRVALIVYGDKPVIVFDFNDHLQKKSLIKAIKKTSKKLRFDSANLGSAVVKTRELFAQDKTNGDENILIILTDMNPTGNDSLLQSEIDQAKLEKIQINVITVALPNATGFERLVSEPIQKHLFKVKSYKDLQIYKKSGKPVVRNIHYLRKKKPSKKRPPITTTTSKTPWPTALKFLSTTSPPYQTKIISTRGPTYQTEFILNTGPPDQTKIISSAGATEHTSTLSDFFITETVFTTQRKDLSSKSSKMKDITTPLPKVLDITTEIPDESIQTTLSDIVQVSDKHIESTSIVDSRTDIRMTTEEDGTIIPTTIDKKGSKTSKTWGTTTQVSETETTHSDDNKVSIEYATRRRSDAGTSTPDDSGIDETKLPDIKGTILSTVTREVVTTEIPRESSTKWNVIHGSDDTGGKRIQNITNEINDNKIGDDIEKGSTKTVIFPHTTNPVSNVHGSERKYTSLKIAVDTTESSNLNTLSINKGNVFESKSTASSSYDTTTHKSFDPLLEREISSKEERNEGKYTNTGDSALERADLSQLKAQKKNLLRNGDEAQVIFAFHVSSTVNQKDKNLLKQFFDDILYRGDVDGGKLKVAVIGYKDVATTYSNFSSFKSKRDLLTLIDYAVDSQWQSTGMTRINAATVFDEVSKILPRDDTPKALIFLTDQQSTVNVESLQDNPRKRELEEVNLVEIFSVAVGTNSKDEPAALASSPDNVLSISEYSNLPRISEELVRRLGIFRSLTVVTPDLKDQMVFTTPPQQKYVTTIKTTPTTTPTPCGFERVDLVIILDSSTSVGQDNFRKMLEFCKDFLKNSDIDSGGVRVGILSYSTEVHDHFYLNAYQNSTNMFIAIENIPWVFGSTNTADALRDMRTKYFSFANGDRPDARNIALILTDGVSNINANRLTDEAERARDEGIHIYAVGIGLSDDTELNQIASIPASENTFSVKDFDELKNLDEQIFRSLCPASTPKLTRPTTTIRTTIASTTTTTTTTTTPIPTTTERTTGYDVILVLDSSVDRRTFDYMKKYANKLVDKLSVDNEEYRVGVMRYSTNPDVQINLDRYNNKVSIMNQISNIYYRGGRTNTDRALDAVRQRMFTRRNGDRDFARNLIVHITGNDRSYDIYDTWAAAERTEKDRINIYTVGIDLQDLTEIDELSSHPLYTYRTLINTSMSQPQVDDSLVNLVRTIDEDIDPWRPRPKPTTTTSTTTTTTTPRNTGKDLIFMLDSSVSPEIFKWMKSYVSNMVQDLDIDNEEYRVGLMKFGTNPSLEAHLKRYTEKDKVLRAVERIGYTPGRTNTDRAINYVRQNMFLPYRGDRNFARNIVVLLTSNDKSANMYRTWDAAEKAERLGINFFTVGINLNDTTEIDELSTHPLSTYRHLVNTNMNEREVDDNINRVLGLVDEDIEPPRPRPKPTTPPPVTTQAPPEKGHDIVVIMDSTVKPEQFRSFRKFVKTLAENVNIDNGDVRMGVMSYSTRPRIQWQLKDYDKKDKIIRAVDRIVYNTGERNTAQAINDANKYMFTRRNGDRNYARNFIILLTGEKESTDRYDAYEAAYQAERDGINLFTIGYYLDDTTEVSEIATHPLRTYRHLVDRESDLLELPGVLQYALNDMGEVPERARLRPQRPTTRPPPTTTRRPGVCKGQGDIVFILDTSGSVGRDGFYKVLNFTYHIISELDIDSGNFRVAVITFSDHPSLEFDLSEYTTRADVEKALKGLNYVYGSTHTASALRLARERVFISSAGDRIDVPNVVITITDGESNIHPENTIPEALLLKRTGATLLTVAVGYTHREEELRGLTTPPVKQNLVRVENFDALHNFSSTLVSPLCNDANKCASKPCQNGAYCIDGIGSYQCVCTNGFHGKNCDKKCGNPADVVFVMDSSDGIGEHTFRRIKGYVDYLVREMNIEECDIRVGAMKYSSAPMVQFGIGQYSDTNTITRMVDHIGYTRGKANMAGAFRSLRTNMFNGNGDRPNVKNIAYLITDGSVEVNEDTTMQEAELAIGSDIQIIPIAVQMRRRDEVESIAVSQGLKTIEIDDDTMLYAMRDEVLDPIYDSNDYCADSPCRNGGQCKNNNGGYLCECKAGFSGDLCQKRCPSKGDIVFAVDASRYVSRKELKDMKKFMKQLVRRMTFRRTGFRVGIVQFAGGAMVRLNLQRGSSKKAVKSAVSGIRRFGSDPNPMEALRKARIRIFGRPADRSTVPNTVIFITKSMRKEHEILREAGKLKLSGTNIIGIGMDLSDSDKDFLKTAVSPPMSSNSFFLPTGESLTSLTDTVMTYLCQENMACSDNPCHNNGTCTSLSSTEYTCACTKGYAGKNCDELNGNVADIAFLVDASGSVGMDNIDKMKQFVYSMIEQISVGQTDNRVAFTSYSSNSQMGFHLDSFYTKKQIMNAISAMQYRYGNTNTAAGLKMVRQDIFDRNKGDRSNIPNILILITDGNSNINSQDTIPEALRLREQGVHIIVVAIDYSGEMNRQEMDAVASQPAAQNVFWVNDYSDLSGVEGAIFAKLSSPDMNKDICDTNEIKCKHGGRCVSAVVTGTYRCECISGFAGNFCEIACPNKFDVAIVIDSSASVGPQNFGLIRNFSSSVVEQLYRISRNNRFAMITFNSEVKTVFGFGRYRDLTSLTSAITGARYKPGGTNTALALRTAHGLLQNDFGTRRSAKNVVILITDEGSNINATETLPAARELKNAGTHVIAIGIGLDIAGESAAQEIRDIASTDDKALIKVNSYGKLREIESDVINQLCNLGEDGSK